MPTQFLEINIKNIQVRLQHGSRFITVTGLLRLLLSRPWNALIEHAPPLCIIRSDSETRAQGPLKDFFDLLDESVSQTAMVRCEKMFWLELPAETSIADHVDREFVKSYSTSRDRRKNMLFSSNSKVATRLTRLISSHDLPALVQSDPGLQLVPQNLVVWMPTSENLLHDMAVRAGRGPCRFYFVLNQFAHPFYRNFMHSAFPPGSDPPVLEYPATDRLGSLLTPAFLRRHQIALDNDLADLTSDCEQEWSYYLDQIKSRSSDESTPDYSISNADFHRLQSIDHAESLKNCRCAYFDPVKQRFTRGPHNPEDFDEEYLVVQGAQTPQLFQQQPIRSAPVQEYSKTGTESIQSTSHIPVAFPTHPMSTTTSPPPSVSIQDEEAKDNNSENQDDVSQQSSGSQQGDPDDEDSENDGNDDAEDA